MRVARPNHPLRWIRARGGGVTKPHTRATRTRANWLIYMAILFQMINDKTFRLRCWLSVLKEVRKEYSGRTIDNIIQNIEARIKYLDKEREQ